MTKEESGKMMRAWLAREDQLNAKDKPILDFLDYADKLLTECNALFNSCAEYLKAPADGRLKPPIPAWRGLNPSPIETNRAVERLVKLMNEASILLPQVARLRQQYNSYLEKANHYRRMAMIPFQNLPPNPDWAMITRNPEEYAPFEVMIDKMLPLLPAYKLKLESIKRQLNIIKEVN